MPLSISVPISLGQIPDVNTTIKLIVVGQWETAELINDILGSCFQDTLRLIAVNSEP